MFRNRLAIVSMVALLALSSISAVHAQGPRRGGRGGGFGPSPDVMKVNLLAVPKVQEDLKLDDEQKSKVQAIAEQMRSDQQSAFAGLQDATQEERQKKMAEFQEKSKVHGEAAAKLLTKEQVQRLDQIVLQAQGARALNDEKVAQALKLTDEQQQKLRDVHADLGAKMREVGFGEGSQEKRAELQKELTDKCLAVLTEDQRTEFASMQGEKLDLPSGAAFGFGGGRGGRGRGRPQ
ncbi:MAG TPA: hypothetical protein VMV10_26565 [Pirellulales bacterium]|nr:hypothetical protein [Pirellulales bacterium]